VSNVDIKEAEFLLPLLLQACKKYPQHANHPAAIVSVAAQKLYLYIDTQPVAIYPVSTSRFGLGQEEGSNKTPLGVHYVKEKIGADADKNEIFSSRQRTNTFANIEHEAKCTDLECITSRILWLSGLEEGVNKDLNRVGKSVDSYERFIYIHGTHEEGLIGQTASIGCVRLKNVDVIEVFEKLSENSLVIINE